MVVIPGDRVRIGRHDLTVAEAYLHGPHLTQITSTDGRTWWAPPTAVRRLDPEPLPVTESWR
ncbi:hypothetical protein Athai_10520 [Actinocatenispora thailandica]|uniref:Uncharacterized protein n=1 Tax=Actinocatenispora thailandica TaxID=227318 RepID=A0A7R7DKS7_9ACTN|nr:hypothetical protein [Actinocatenispora thailandica]BCJ33549.1 hypothetical protein Athai_10520 [Actinocatenispora thailandica]